MRIPEPPKKLPKETRKWLSQLREALLTGQSKSGNHSLCKPYPGKGTVIDFDRNRTPSTVVAGPCPDPCPDAITIRFSGVAMDCGCLPSGTGRFQSFEATEGGLFNERDIVMNLDCEPGDPLCVYDFDGGSFGIHIKFWFEFWFGYGCGCFGDPSCPDPSPPHIERDAYEFDSLGPWIYISCVDGTWYIAAGVLNALLFYATTTDISGPVVNELTGCGSPEVFLDYDFFNCDGSMFTSLKNVAGHSGNAVITLP